MESFVRDLRFAGRMLISRPGFTVLAVVCLALGIGASAAIFSVVNGVLLKPLPFPDAERLVAYGIEPGRTSSARCPRRISSICARGVDARRSRGCTTSSRSACATATPRCSSAAHAISSNLFRVLGVAPLLGRAPSAGRGAAEARTARS